MKTIKQYLEEIPDPEIRDLALKNMYQEYAGEWSTSLPAALKRAFLFCRSAEGYDYWIMVHNSLQ